MGVGWRWQNYFTGKSRNSTFTKETFLIKEVLGPHLINHQRLWKMFTSKVYSVYVRVLETGTNRLYFVLSLREDSVVS